MDGFELDWPATDDDLQVNSTLRRSISPRPHLVHKNLRSISNTKFNSSIASITVEEVDQENTKPTLEKVKQTHKKNNHSIGV